MGKVNSGFSSAIFAPYIDADPKDPGRWPALLCIQAGRSAC